MQKAVKQDSIQRKVPLIGPIFPTASKPMCCWQYFILWFASSLKKNHSKLLLFILLHYRASSGFTDCAACVAGCFSILLTWNSNQVLLLLLLLLRVFLGRSRCLLTLSSNNHLHIQGVDEALVELPEFLLHIGIHPVGCFWWSLAFDSATGRHRLSLGLHGLRLHNLHIFFPWVFSKHREIWWQPAYLRLSCRNWSNLWLWLRPWLLRKATACSISLSSSMTGNLAGWVSPWWPIDCNSRNHTALPLSSVLVLQPNAFAEGKAAYLGKCFALLKRSGRWTLSCFCWLPCNVGYMVCPLLYELSRWGYLLDLWSKLYPFCSCRPWPPQRTDSVEPHLQCSNHVNHAGYCSPRYHIADKRKTGQWSLCSVEGRKHHTNGVSPHPCNHHYMMFLHQLSR